ncbi:MAG: hypothetical protein KGL39_57870, partial [Patescibacteria group bacterium]|nr:hypothetical protein [Patescibacteria group bacterium]
LLLGSMPSSMPSKTESLRRVPDLTPDELDALERLANAVIHEEKRAEASGDEWRLMVDYAERDLKDAIEAETIIALLAMARRTVWTEKVSDRLAWLVENTDGIIGLKHNGQVMSWSEVIAKYLPFYFTTPNEAQDHSNETE